MKWWAEENEHCWQLFYGDNEDFPPRHPYQIIKALKPNKDFKSPMTEYWPNKKDSEFIVDALNEAEKTRTLGPESGDKK